MLIVKNMQDRTLFLSVYAILYTKGLLSGGGGGQGGTKMQGPLR